MLLNMTQIVQAALANKLHNTSQVNLRPPRFVYALLIFYYKCEILQCKSKTHKNKILSRGNSTKWHDGGRACAQSFYVPATYKCKKLKQNLLQI